MTPVHSALRFRALIEDGLRQIEAVLWPAWEEALALLSRFPEDDPLYRMSINNAAKHLHDFYQALETLVFERVVDETQEGRPASRQYHAELLRQMSTAIPGLRPAVISESLAVELDELRRFHHLFESVYAPFLDPAKVIPLASRQPAVVRRALAEVRAFLDVLVDTKSG